MKLKKILEESNAPGFKDRKFGDALPTMASVKAAYDAKNGITEVELTEAPMDNRFAKEWEKNCKVLITHLEHEQKGKLGAHKGTVKKMIDMLRTVKGYPELMGSLFGEQ